MEINLTEWNQRLVGTSLPQEIMWVQVMNRRSSCLGVGVPGGKLVNSREESEGVFYKQPKQYYNTNDIYQDKRINVKDALLNSHHTHPFLQNFSINIYQDDKDSGVNHSYNKKPQTDEESKRAKRRLPSQLEPQEAMTSFCFTGNWLIVTESFQFSALPVRQKSDYFHRRDTIMKTQGPPRPHKVFQSLREWPFFISDFHE